MEPIIERFRALRPQLKKDEVWREVDFDAYLTDDLRTATPAERTPFDLTCNIPDLETLRIVVENGYLTDAPLQTDEGIVVGSVRGPLPGSVPEAVRQQVGRQPSNPYNQLNAEGYTDGFLIYVPDWVAARLPLQILSVATASHSLLTQTRNVVALGRNSHLTLVQCDDSLNTSRNFANNVTYVSLADGAHLELYKMQNLTDSSALLNQTYVDMQHDCHLQTHALTLNGGHIRNHTEIRMHGAGCTTEAHGLYLIDKNQEADNYIFVDHAAPHCTSRTLFKGIMDDAARATFNGHVLVAEGATKTEAFQTNNNILLTDKALVNTRPFLEIYNDDVKCSHGTTTGQIDEQALFYIRSRGVSLRTAQTLLLYAFCDEVIQTLSLPTLREKLSDMVKKRLHGELTPCADCALQCGESTAPSFHIDPSKL